MLFASSMIKNTSVLYQWLTVTTYSYIWEAVSGHRRLRNKKPRTSTISYSRSCHLAHIPTIFNVDSAKNLRRKKRPMSILSEQAKCNNDSPNPLHSSASFPEYSARLSTAWPLWADCRTPSSLFFQYTPYPYSKRCLLKGFLYFEWSPHALNSRQGGKSSANGVHGWHGALG